jgi:AcrR family transcriptional regulator
MIEIAAAHGYEGVTVRGLTKRARVSSGTFYKHYSSTEDCLICTFDEVCGRVSRRMTEAAEAEPEPSRRLAAAVGRLFEDMVAVPQVTTFMLRAAPTVGPAFVDELGTSAMRLGAALDFCLRDEGNPPLDPLLLEGMVAGLARIGSTLLPVAGESRLEQVTVGAVDWATSVSGPLDPAAPSDAAPPERGGGLLVPGRLRNGNWEGMLGDKRSMLLAATFWIARRGYDQLSIARICREAGVSRRDFDRHFESLDHIFIAAVEQHATQVIEASDSLDALRNAIEADPDSARVLLVDLTAAGTRGIDCRDRLISKAAQVWRASAAAGQSPTEGAAEASAAATWAILRRRVAEDGKHEAGDGKHLGRKEKPTPPLLEFP